MSCFASVAAHRGIGGAAGGARPGIPGTREAGAALAGEQEHRMGTTARAELRSALHQLETQAQAVRKAAGKPGSRREAAKQAGLSGQRISDWLNDDPAKAPHRRTGIVSGP